MTELNHNINLRMGDWSDDGHGKSDVLSIRSNLSKSEITDAYKKGVEIVGFDPVQELCRSYEDRSLSEEHKSKLLAAGFELDKEVEEWNGTYSFWPDSYPSVYLFFVSKGNPNFKFESTSEHDTFINIGGYGLFYI